MPEGFMAHDVSGMAPEDAEYKQRLAPGDPGLQEMCDVLFCSFVEELRGVQ